MARSASETRWSEAIGEGMGLWVGSGWEVRCMCEREEAGGGGGGCGGGGDGDSGGGGGWSVKFQEQPRLRDDLHHNRYHNDHASPLPPSPPTQMQP